MSQSRNPPLRTVAEARAIMLAAVERLAPEMTDLEQALGRVLADAIITSRDQPPFAVSAMDGYAVRSADTPGRLRLGGESAAGHGFEGLCQPGMAIRISTGAALPDGADSVVIQEDVQRQSDVTGDSITVPAAARGDNTRPRGGDFAAGATLLPAGFRLDGIAVSLVAATGAAQARVIRAPRIAILSSGDELAAPGSPPGKFQIFDSATFGIAGLVRAWGGVPHRLAVEKDDAGAIARAAENGLRGSDLLVVIGGASVGDHDQARPALMRLGLEFLVEKVAVRPGKPTWFGKTGHGSVLGLPGNPASALACARLFLRPLIDRMLGRDPETSLVLRRAKLKHALPANGPREHYLRALLEADEDGQLVVRAFEDQDSSLISVFAAANALIRQPAGTQAMAEGALVDVLPLESL